MTSYNNTVLIIGASGIGKTTACEAAAALLPSVEFITSDSILKNSLVLETGEAQSARKFRHGKSPREFLARTQQAIDEYLRVREAIVRPLAIDVGAGCHGAPDLLGWIKAMPSIALVARSETTYERIKRRREEERTLVQFRRDEYNAAQRLLYDSATRQVNANVAADQVAEQLATSICELLEL